MEELIYFLIKFIAGAMSDSKAKQQPAPGSRAWHERVAQQQRLMQQAALAASVRPVRVPVPPPLRRAVPVAPVRPVQPVDAKWVDTERASRHDAGSGRSSEMNRLIQPASLRRRFILTEILRPPVSMRPPRI